MQSNPIQPNQFNGHPMQFNPIQSSSIQFNPTWSNSVQTQCNFNPIQSNSYQSNSIQFNQIQSKPNAIQSNSIQFNPIRFNQIQFSPIQFNPIKSNPIQPNQIRCKSNAIQSNSIQTHISSYVLRPVQDFASADMTQSVLPLTFVAFISSYCEHSWGSSVHIAIVSTLIISYCDQFKILPVQIWPKYVSRRHFGSSGRLIRGCRSPSCCVLCHHIT